MKYVLDDELLDGPHEVQVSLRPERHARCVGDLAQAESIALHLCQTWGGAGNPIVPVGNGAPVGYLRDALVAAEVDGYTATADGIDGKIPYLEAKHAWDYPAPLIVAHEPREGSRRLENVTLRTDDPWRMAYLACLGQMPDRLNDSLLSNASLRALTIDDVIPIEHVAVTGSLDDLLTRLKNYVRITPRQFSCLYLASGSNPNTGYFGSDRVMRDRWDRATAAGPNIIVVMDPGSVEDFALLWNLRAHWGDSRPMPIGVPHDQLNAEALRKLHEPGITTFFGFGGGHLFLVSESVSFGELEQLASLSTGVEVATPSELARFGFAPSRSQDQVQIWTEGTARVSPMSDSDREVLRATQHRRPQLKLSVLVPALPIPAVGPLRGVFSPDYQCGAAQVSATPFGNSVTVEVHWPTRWTCLKAAALNHGLDVRPSQPGIAAQSLQRAIGNVHDVRNLADPQLIELLYGLAERSGMSWWKDRWNRLERQLRDEGRSEKDIQALADATGRDDPVIAPPNEGRQLPFSRFQQCFGRRDAAEHWLTWAIERQLIVKGVELKCPDCRVPFWLPVQDLAPPHTCPGCARSLTHPFRPDGVGFKYRVGEALRRCLEVDALGHVLAMRWLVELFERHGLVGAHPGVEFVKDGVVVAEVDVVLLFRDGALAPVEVKRRARAFDEDAVLQLERASAILDASFDVMCVLESADRCVELAPFKRFAPDRPRFLLTSDQLAALHVFWALGANPFEGQMADEETPAKRREAWLAGLVTSNDHAADPVDYTLDYWRRQTVAIFQD